MEIEKYETPSAEVIQFPTQDVITTSGDDPATGGVGTGVGTPMDKWL